MKYIILHINQNLCNVEFLNKYTENLNYIAKQHKVLISRTKIC